MGKVISIVDGLKKKTIPYLLVNALYMQKTWYKLIRFFCIKGHKRKISHQNHHHHIFLPEETRPLWMNYVAGIHLNLFILSPPSLFCLLPPVNEISLEIKILHLVTISPPYLFSFTSGNKQYHHKDTKRLVKQTKMNAFAIIGSNFTHRNHFHPDTCF